MKALMCTTLGPPENLHIEDLPSPRAGARQVVIDVKAAGVNYPDALIVQGKYQVKPPLPFAPGGELAGIVKETGEGVQGIKPGDAVLALTGSGAFAEEVVADIERVIPLPAGANPEVAASVMIAYGTSYHALKD